MRQYFAAGLGMLAGFAIGAVAVTGLHAQGKPTFYLVTEIDVTNPEAYGKEFAPKAQATIRRLPCHAGLPGYSPPGPRVRMKRGRGITPTPCPSPYPGG